MCNASKNAGTRASCDVLTDNTQSLGIWATASPQGISPPSTNTTQAPGSAWNSSSSSSLGSGAWHTRKCVCRNTPRSSHHFANASGNVTSLMHIVVKKHLDSSKRATFSRIHRIWAAPAVAYVEGFAVVAMDAMASGGKRAVYVGAYRGRHTREAHRMQAACRRMPMRRHYTKSSPPLVTLTTYTFPRSRRAVRTSRLVDKADARKRRDIVAMGLSRFPMNRRPRTRSIICT